MNMQQYESVRSILRGYNSPDYLVTAREICLSVGINPRELRSIVAGMRTQNELIAGNPRGYFLAKDWDQYAIFVSPQVKNSATYLREFNRLRKVYTGQNDDQVELALNIYDNHKKGIKMERKSFTYQKQSNGEISDRTVLVIKETDTEIEGIDMGNLSPSEAHALNAANDIIKRLQKTHYRRFLKKGIK